MDVKKRKLEPSENYEDQVLDLSKPKSKSGAETELEVKAKPQAQTVTFPFLIRLDHLNTFGYPILQKASINPNDCVSRSPDLTTVQVTGVPWSGPLLCNVTQEGLNPLKTDVVDTSPSSGESSCSPVSSDSSVDKQRSKSKKILMCPQKGCGEEFKCSRMLKHHVEGCDMDRNYKCPCCKQTSKTLALFLEHVRTHDFLDSSVQARRQVSKKSVPCPVEGCETSVKNLTQHLKTYHKTKAIVE